MIISGGVNVYPAEIENVIMNIRGVNQVAVIGIPDEKWGEVAMAFISLNKGAQLSDEVVLKACSENLSRYKMPRKIKFIEDLPKSTAGKREHRRSGKTSIIKGDSKSQSAMLVFVLSPSCMMTACAILLSLARNCAGTLGSKRKPALIKYAIEIKC